MTGSTPKTAIPFAGVAGILSACSCLAQDGVPPSTNLADRICSNYEQRISTVSCGIRRIGGSAGVVSRVFYKQPNRINVENITPSKRRIIADGKTLHYFEEGSRMGFSKPVEALTGDWLLSLRNIPGTPMRNILDLRTLPEEILAPTAEYPVRRQYKSPQARAVLSCDTNERLARLEFFRLAEPETLMVRYEYDDYKSVAAGCWMPMVHRTLVRLPDGKEYRETTRVENMTVNQPVAESLFAWENFFPKVEFTDDFQKTYEP